MSEDPRRASERLIREFWRNEMWEDAEDDVDRMMITLLEEEEQRLQASRRNARSTNSRRYVNRDREDGHSRLVKDYFAENPTFHDEVFRRRFRMRRELFVRIVDALTNHSEYFQWRRDAAGRQSLSPLQKCTAAIRQLAYAAPADSLDEYVRMGERTALDCLINFCQCVIDVFGARYLRRPNHADTQRLLLMHDEKHGFPGMLGSLDCMHWEWRRNCPVAWKRQYTRGSRNDINVLNESSLFNAVLQGNAPNVHFTVNKTTYTKGYYLTDGIYPEWAAFVKRFPCPEDPKRKKFKERQESARKDVERAFGVLQARWAIVRGPARSYYKNDLRNIMYTCIILHNMIIEDEGDKSVNWSDEDSPPPARIVMSSTQEFREYLHNYSELRDREAHHQLRADLVEHIWARHGCD